MLPAALGKTPSAFADCAGSPILSPASGGVIMAPMGEPDQNAAASPSPPAPAAAPSPVEQLATPVQFLKGVGPQRAELLERLGLHTARDVLFFFPRDYQDLTDRRDVDELEEGKLQSVRGAVEDIELAAPAPAAASWACWSAAAGGLPPGHVVQSALHARAVRPRPAGAGLRQAASCNGLVWEMAHPARGDPGRGRRRAAGPHPARLSAHRGAAAMADAADRARGAASATPTAGRSLPGRVSCRPTTSGRCAGPCRRSISPRPREPRSRPGGGWSIRSCSSCSWPWP